jgi:hypothetical protein
MKERRGSGDREMTDKIMALWAGDTTQHHECAQSSGLELELADLGSVGRVRYVAAIIAEKTYRSWQKH